MDKVFNHIPVVSLNRHPWLFIRYYWYKWIRRKPIIGFYDKHPIFISEDMLALEEEE